MIQPVKLSPEHEEKFNDIPITRKYISPNITGDPSPEQTLEAYQNLWGWLHEIFELLHEGSPFSFSGQTKDEIERAVRGYKNSMEIISDYHASLTHRSVMKRLLAMFTDKGEIQKLMDELQSQGIEIPQSMRSNEFWEKF